jgi:cytochrome c-type protein NapC
MTHERRNDTPGDAEVGNAVETQQVTWRGRIRQFWTFITRPHATIALGSLLLVGFVAGIIVWGGFNWSMELTNSQEFCVSCHEMERNVFREYRETSHYSNRTGVRATCPDCHVPDNWFHKVARKIRASAELYHHLVGSIDTREKFEDKRVQLATRVWRTMKETDSRECRNCHNFDFMDYALQESRASRRHQQGIDDGRTCIDCHKGIVHTLPDEAYEAWNDMQEQLAADGGG